MVKNEMNLHVQQTYDMALKLSEAEIRKIKSSTSIHVKSLNDKMKFKNVKNEITLFNKRKEDLNENVLALFTNSKHDAKTVVLKNAAQLHRLNWSFNKRFSRSWNANILKQAQGWF